MRLRLTFRGGDRAPAAGRAEEGGRSQTWRGVNHECDGKSSKGVGLVLCLCVRAAEEEEKQEGGGGQMRQVGSIAVAGVRGED